MTTTTTTVVMMLASLILDSNPSVTVSLLRYSFVQTVQRIRCHHENTKRGGVQSRRRCIFQMLLLFLQQHNPNTFLMISQKKTMQPGLSVDKGDSNCDDCKGRPYAKYFQNGKFFLDLSQAIIGMMIKGKSSSRKFIKSLSGVCNLEEASNRWF